MMGKQKDHNNRIKLSIVKIGGNIIEDPASLEQFTDKFAQLKGLKILVHGGGKHASKLESKLGIPTRQHQGRRITTEESLDVVLMVYAGLLNKKITALLQSKNCNAAGMSGADANAILAVKRPVKDIDFGLVGDVVSIDASILQTMLQAGIVPVFCAITHDGNGQLLNTNADTIASELAIGLSSDYDTTLYYCFEKKGVLSEMNNEDSVIKHINKERYRELLEKNIIHTGMLPKLHNCFRALESQVSKICIGDMNMLDDEAKNYTTVTL